MADDEQKMRYKFAAKMRGGRAEQRITQEQLSCATGISVQSIREYERATMTPSLEKAYAIADALGMELDELVGR